MQHSGQAQQQPTVSESLRDAIQQKRQQLQQALAELKKAAGGEKKLKCGVWPCPPRINKSTGTSSS
jgi:hypothetical protein